MSSRLAICTACGGSGAVKVRREVERDVMRADSGRVTARRLVETVADACPACAALAEAEFQSRAGREMEER